MKSINGELFRDLDIEVIKNVEGKYSASEFVDMFKNMFFSRMIIDITAISDYMNIENLEKIVSCVPADKIILFLPVVKEVTSSLYLSKLISIGIYNFTTNIEGVRYLLKNPNSYKDVTHIQQMGDLSYNVNKNMNNGNRIFGIRNLTNHAGATTLIYMLKRELEDTFNLIVYGIEIGKHDFDVFNDKRMISTSSSEVTSVIEKLNDASVILIDMNDFCDDELCENVLYLLEPSIIMLNKLVRKNKNIFSELKGSRIVLNKSFLDDNDVLSLEKETNAKFFYNIPSLDDRKKNNIIKNFLSKLGFNNVNDKSKTDDKIVGLFKK